MNRFAYPLLSFLLLLLAGCGGVFQIELAPDAGDDAPADPTPVASSPARVALTSYSDSRRGFTLPVPQDAVVEELEDDGSYAIGFGRPEEGFRVLVQVHSDLPPETAKPAALLRHIFATDTLPGELTPINTGGLDGTWLALPEQSGQTCEQIVPVSAAYTDGRRAFSLLIQSDTSGRCNAALLPETQAILNGFTIDRDTVAPMTPTPVPTPPIEVAYLKEDNVWLWTEGEGRFTLFEEQGAEGEVRLHPEGRWVAFMRDGHLWVVSRDGEDERALTDESTFAGQVLANGEIEVLGFRPYAFAWVPDSDLLLFNTSPILEGPGLLLSNDLWQADAATGEVTNLLPPGEGGAFTLSPDGDRLSLVRPDAIEVAAIDGSNRRQLLSYEPVLTYSEYQYYAQPVWSPDGTALRVALPPADPLGDPDQGTAIWHLTPAGTPPRKLGEVAASQIPPGAGVAIAPDLKSVAFLRTAEDGSGMRHLLLAPLADAVGEPTLYAEGVEMFHGWAPGGDAFLYTPIFTGAQRLFIGRADSAPQPVGDPASAVLAGAWAGPDRTTLVYLQQSDGGWEIRLDRGEGEHLVLDTVRGAPPSLDTPQ